MSENSKLQPGVDIVVVTSNESIDFYGNDVFLDLPGIPKYCVGISFMDNEITLVHALKGEPTLLYVESPTESGAAMPYEPVEAVDALLNEVGITLKEGKFTLAEGADVSKAKPLTDFSEEVTEYSEYCIDNAEDLSDQISGAYGDNAWE